jgi:hypothetical protein
MFVLLYPRMLANLLKIGPFGRLILQNTRDQVLYLVAQVRWELKVNSLDSLVGHLVTLGLEGRVTHNEFVAEDAQRPNVYSVVVRLVNHHFWGQVVESSAKCVSSVVRGVN